MTITTIASIQAAYRRALDLGATHEEALASVHQATGQPLDLIEAALEREEQLA